jgi:hypothetical protein
MPIARAHCRLRLLVAGLALGSYFFVPAATGALAVTTFNDDGDEWPLPTLQRGAASSSSSSSFARGAASYGRRLGDVTVIAEAKCYNGSRAQLLRDPGFERIPLGPLPDPTGIWSVSRARNVPNIYVNGASTLTVDRTPPRRFLTRQVLLSIPGNASKVSSHAGIAAAIAGCNKTNVVYEVSADVRWMNAALNITAVLSLWAVHPGTVDANGLSFSGVDYWIANSTWNRYAFRFMLPNRKQLGKPPSVILTLHPNQTPRLTTLRIDNVRVTEACALGRTSGPPDPTEMLLYGTFDGLPLGTVEDNSTYFDVQHLESNAVTAAIVQDAANASNQMMQMVLPAGNTNYDVKQVGEIVTLHMGTRYNVSACMRRNSDPTGPAIVNFRMQSVATGVWYGRVDQILPADDQWHTHWYVVGIPETGPYLVSLQLNGWGNYGRELDVSFDDFSCRPV